MTVERRVAERSLKKKGFIKEKDRDHIFYYHEDNGRRTGAYTYFSHSAKIKTLGPDLLKRMSPELSLDSIQETADLLACPMNGDIYKTILFDKGLL